LLFAPECGTGVLANTEQKWSMKTPVHHNAQCTIRFSFPASGALEAADGWIDGQLSTDKRIRKIPERDIDPRNGAGLSQSWSLRWSDLEKIVINGHFQSEEDAVEALSWMLGNVVNSSLGHEEEFKIQDLTFLTALFFGFTTIHLQIVLNYFWRAMFLPSGCRGRKSCHVLRQRPTWGVELSFTLHHHMVKQTNSCKKSSKWSFVAQGTFDH
jgi:hypothetical protein